MHQWKCQNTAQMNNMAVIWLEYSIVYNQVASLFL